MSIAFNGTVYPTGYVAEDDGPPAAAINPDAVSSNPITLNGTVTRVGDTVTATGLLPGGVSAATTNTLYVTQYDNSGQILFANYNPNTTTTAPADATRYIFSNTPLQTGRAGRVTFASDPALVNGTDGDVYMVCFVSGTLIATIDGEVAVENLKAGDVVVTASGAHRSIKWIGHRAYSGAFVRRNAAALPIRFAAGSLGNGLPRRDLLVSPKHAMVLDGMLVAAELLVNGRSITRVARVESLAYYHVELDSHDVLLAEGAPSESYVADNNRGFFHNAAELGQHEDREALYCLPRIEQGYALEALRERLNGLVGGAEDVQAA